MSCGRTERKICCNKCVTVMKGNSLLNLDKKLLMSTLRFESMVEIVIWINGRDRLIVLKLMC